MRLVPSLLLAALLAPAAARAQAKPTRVASAAPAAPRPAAPSAPAVRPADSTSFTVGKRLYLRSNGTFIGTIIDAEEQHDFRGGRFPRPWMRGVLVVRRDGPYEWMPVEGLSRLYTAR